MRAIAAQDGLAAFEYYMANHNHGRPFILAGHSQGSDVLLYIMEYLNEKLDFLDRMVASYVIGYSVTPEYLSRNSQLKFATGRTDTRVIISWNTEAPQLEGPNPIVLPGAMSINPISWSRDNVLAPAANSLGSRMRKDGQMVDIDNLADAQINAQRGTVICTTVDPAEYVSALFPKGVLHGVDYDLYYYDLKQNIKDRIKAFLNE